MARELSTVVPNSEYKSRRRFALKKIIPECVKHGVTDLIVINENRDVPDLLTLCHLPHGPTATFKLRSVKLMEEIKVRNDFLTAHRTEIRLGTRFGQ